MKNWKWCWFIGVVILVGSARAQNNVIATLCSNKSYTNSQTDTHATKTLGSYLRLSLYYYVTDTAAADVYFDHRPDDGSWTNAVYSDSIIVEAATGGRGEITIRNNILDRVTGFGDYRVRVVWRSSGNGDSGTSYVYWEGR